MVATGLQVTSCYLKIWASARWTPPAGSASPRRENVERCDIFSPYSGRPRHQSRRLLPLAADRPAAGTRPADVSKWGHASERKKLHAKGLRGGWRKTLWGFCPQPPAISGRFAPHLGMAEN